MYQHFGYNPLPSIQSLSWKVLGQLEIIMGVSWASLSLYLGRRRRAALSINKLTQGRYQASTPSCCSGENIPLSFLFSPGPTMSGWLGRKEVVLG